MSLVVVLQRECLAGGERITCGLGVTLHSSAVSLLTACVTLCRFCKPQCAICKMGMYSYLLYKVVIRIKMLQVNPSAHNRCSLHSLSLSSSMGCKHV